MECNLNAATSNLAQAQETLLSPAGIDESGLAKLFNRLMTHHIDYADLYFQRACVEHWSLEDGVVREAGSSVDHGVGVRATAGDRTGFAYSDELAVPALEAAADAARSIASHGGPMRLNAWTEPKITGLYGSENPLLSLDADAKVAILHELDQVARQQDPRVRRVAVSLSASHETILIATSSGILSADVRPLVRINVTVTAEQSGRYEQGYAGGGGRYGYAELIGNGKPQEFARDAVRQALVALEARPAPAGVFPVVLGPGWPGVLLHEAVGHGLEGDFIRKGTSAFCEKLGKQVASDLCTVVDDGTLPQRRGSLAIDDEGVATQRTVLIQDGVLTGYMYDTLNARLSGVASTGNGRRESFAHRPMPRMTNTYLMPGQDTPEEIISSVDKGLYAVNFGGGQVDITSGKFVFSASEAYLIENGRIADPVRGATLIGSGPDVLKEVSMVGNDLALDEGVGICGKDGQSVPVGVGMPTVRVDQLTVGGTQR